MTRVVLTRLLQTVPLLVGTSALIFLLIHTAPGGPETVLVDPRNVSIEDLQRIRANLGLNRPLYVQYLSWAADILQGDFGRSFVDGRPVIGLLREKLPNTFLLLGSGFALALVFSLPIGIYAGVHSYSRVNDIVTSFTYAGAAIPNFWLGLVLIYVFSVKLQWLPSGGIHSLTADVDILDRSRHLILPAVVLSLAASPIIVRQVRAGVLGILSAAYVTTARSKGLTEVKVLLRHVLPEALLPAITVLALTVPYLISASVVVETLFTWNGLGRTMVLSIYQRDYPVTIALSILLSLSVVLANLAADLLYFVMDPRQRE